MIPRRFSSCDTSNPCSTASEVQTAHLLVDGVLVNAVLGGDLDLQRAGGADFTICVAWGWWRRALGFRCMNARIAHVVHGCQAPVHGRPDLSGGKNGAASVQSMQLLQDTCNVRLRSFICEEGVERRPGVNEALDVEQLQTAELCTVGKFVLQRAVDEGARFVRGQGRFPAEYSVGRSVDGIDLVFVRKATTQFSLQHDVVDLASPSINNP